MHSIARAGARPIEKHVDAGGVPVDKAGLCQGLGRPAKIRAAEHEIHILREAHGRLVDLLHPGHHGVTTDHRVGNSRGLEGRRRTQQPVANLLHGTLHAVEGEQTVVLRHHIGRLPVTTSYLTAP